MTIFRDLQSKVLAKKVMKALEDKLKKWYDSICTINNNKYHVGLQFDFIIDFFIQKGCTL